MSDAGAPPPGQPLPLGSLPEPLPESQVELPEEDRAGADPYLAATEAVRRARRAAVDRGLRPGRPGRRSGRDLARRGGRAGGGTGSGSGPTGRDPQLLGSSLDRLLVDRGWGDDVRVGSVMGDWARIVGDDVAAHVQPVTYDEGVLVVRADSTAWATQMRLMSSSLLGRVEAELGHGVVTEIRVQGPAAPSWVKGPRRVRGQGPRDTYG